MSNADDQTDLQLLITDAEELVPVLEGGLPDVNRTQRQQEFLRAIMAEAGSNRNPFTMMSAAEKMSGGLRIDDDMKRPLIFGAPPKRVVSLVPSDTFNLAAIGCGDALVGRTEIRDGVAQLS